MADEGESANSSGSNTPNGVRQSPRASNLVWCFIYAPCSWSLGKELRNSKPFHLHEWLSRASGKVKEAWGEKSLGVRCFARSPCALNGSADGA